MGVQQVDMLCICGSDGAVHPLRFRFADETQQVRVVDITEVVSCEEITYVGVEGYLYVCRTHDGIGEHLIEIKYTARTHKWAIRRMIY